MKECEISCTWKEGEECQKRGGFMVGLREKKKKETRKKIISAAKELLLDKGYNEATMEEISERAEIGVGTLYNYFKSKAEIFVRIMSDELLIDSDDSEELEIDLEQTAARLVMDYLRKYASKLRFFSKKLWRELFAATFGSTGSNNLMLKGIMNIDFQFIAKMEGVLRVAKDNNILPESFDCHQGAINIYSIVITQTILYVYQEEISFDDFTASIEVQVNFLFEGSVKNNRKYR